jgi:hypothetical protein
VDSGSARACGRDDERFLNPEADADASSSSKYWAHGERGLLLAVTHNLILIECLGPYLRPAVTMLPPSATATP